MFSCVISTHIDNVEGFLRRIKLAREIKGHFSRDLSFFLYIFGEIIIVFELREFKKMSSPGKNVIEKNVYNIEKL